MSGQLTTAQGVGLVQSGVGAAGSAISDFGGAAADLTAAQGAGVEATAYQQAAAYSANEASLAQVSGNVQIAQQQRQAYQVISSGQAAAGGNGLSNEGSAHDIARASASQLALGSQVLGVNTAINVNAYQKQASAETGEADAALSTEAQDKTTASAQQGAGIASGISSVIGLVAGAIALF